MCSKCKASYPHQCQFIEDCVRGPFRGFEVVADEFRKFPGEEINLPLIGTTESAGCDIYSNEDAVVEPLSFHEFWLDIRAKIPQGEYCTMHLRSSMGRKGWRNALDTGIIDSDYFDNQSTGGNIMLKLQNMTDEPMSIKSGERIGQIIFNAYKRANYGVQDPGTIRTGGYGSTN